MYAIHTINQLVYLALILSTQQYMSVRKHTDASGFEHYDGSACFSARDFIVL